MQGSVAPLDDWSCTLMGWVPVDSYNLNLCGMPLFGAATAPLEATLPAPGPGVTGTFTLQGVVGLGATAAITNAVVLRLD